MKPQLGASRCFHGTVECANTAEVVFNYDYDLIKSTEQLEVEFKQLLQSAVGRLFDSNLNMIAGIHLSEGSIVAAVEFVQPHWKQKLDRLVTDCKMCIALNGERLCAHGRSQVPCPQPPACIPNPCINGGVCLPQMTASKVAPVSSSNMAAPYAGTSHYCVCPTDTVGAHCARMVTVPPSDASDTMQREGTLGTTTQIAILALLVMFFCMSLYLFCSRLCGRADPRHKHKMEGLDVHNQPSRTRAFAMDDMAWDDPFSMGPVSHAPGVSPSMRSMTSPHILSPQQQMSLASHHEAIAQSLRGLGSSPAHSWYSGSEMEGGIDLKGERSGQFAPSPSRYLQSPDGPGGGRGGGRYVNGGQNDGTPFTSPMSMDSQTAAMMDAEWQRTATLEMEGRRRSNLSPLGSRAYGSEPGGGNRRFSNHVGESVYHHARSEPGNRNSGLVEYLAGGSDFQDADDQRCAGLYSAPASRSRRRPPFSPPDRHSKTVHKDVYSFLSNNQRLSNQPSRKRGDETESAYDLSTIDGLEDRFGEDFLPDHVYETAAEMRSQMQIDVNPLAKLHAALNTYDAASTLGSDSTYESASAGGARFREEAAYSTAQTGGAGADFEEVTYAVAGQGNFLPHQDGGYRCDVLQGEATYETAEVALGMSRLASKHDTHESVYEIAGPDSVEESIYEVAMPDNQQASAIISPTHHEGIYAEAVQTPRGLIRPNNARLLSPEEKEVLYEQAMAGARGARSPPTRGHQQESVYDLAVAHARIAGTLSPEAKIKYSTNSNGSGGSVLDSCRRPNAPAFPKAPEPAPRSTRRPRPVKGGNAGRQRPGTTRYTGAVNPNATGRRAASVISPMSPQPSNPMDGDGAEDSNGFYESATLLSTKNAVYDMNSGVNMRKPMPDFNKFKSFKGGIPLSGRQTQAHSVISPEAHRAKSPEESLYETYDNALKQLGNKAAATIEPDDTYQTYACINSP